MSQDGEQTDIHLNMFHSRRDWRDYIEGNWDFVIPTCFIKLQKWLHFCHLSNVSEESDSDKSTDFVFLWYTQLLLL